MDLYIWPAMRVIHEIKVSHCSKRSVSLPK